MRIVPVVSLLLLVAACSDPKITSIGGITEEEFDGLVAPVAGSEPADYRAKDRHVRLFGIQGDPAFATIADTATWQMWNLRVDETLGLGLRTQSVAGAITLANANGGAVTIAPGREGGALRTITH